MTNKPELIIFDLDGTLVDSAPDLAYSIDTMLEQLGRPPAGEVAVRSWIGNGVSALVKRALINALDYPEHIPEYNQAYRVFLDIYQDNLCGRGQIYDGVITGLDSLKKQGYQLACITNKAKRYTIPLLDQLGLADYFKLVTSGDSHPQRKPHPCQY
jgi:phosphoglycolate phosphatase